MRSFSFAAAALAVCAAMVIGSARSACLAAQFSTLYTLNTACDGFAPQPGMLLASDGNFYGVTEAGGTNGDGTLFRLSPTGVFITLHSFVGNAGYGDPSDPNGGLIQAPNGLIYGTSVDGGKYQYGTIWSWDPSSQKLSVLWSFSSPGLIYPSDGPTIGPSGMLYGETAGAPNTGIAGAYEILPNGANYHQVATFSASYASRYPVVYDPTTSAFYATAFSANGDVVYAFRRNGTVHTMYTFEPSSPFGYGPSGICLGQDGRLYMSVEFGGKQANGAIESIAPGSKAPRIVYSFTGGADGVDPIGPLIVGPGGVMYGAGWAGIDSTGQSARGVIFSVTDAGSLKTLSTFPASDAYGEEPLGPVALTPDGTTLVATCQTDPENRLCGAIDSIPVAGNAAPAVLHDFFAQGFFTGGLPDAGLIYDPVDGNYYGTATLTEGAGRGGGCIIRMTPAGQVTTPYCFGDGSPDNVGDSPLVGLTIGFDSHLVGVASNGSKYGNGALFDYDPVALSEFDIALLPASGDGAQPDSNVVDGSDGNYYFTSTYGGANGTGALVQVNPATGIVTDVYSFSQTGATDGDYPQGEIVEQNGIIFGTCMYNGAESGGTLWSWSSTGGLSVLRSFVSEGTLGWLPNGVSSSSSGSGLYGVCESSISYGGTLYKFTPGSAPRLLKQFSGSVCGHLPSAPPVQGADGTLYGTCTSGGLHNDGTVWSLVPGVSFQVLAAFDGNGPTAGSDPKGMLMIGPDGNLYGTTYSGGVPSQKGDAVLGTIFKITLP